MNHVMRKVFGIATLVFSLICTGSVTAQGGITDTAFFKLCAEGTAEEIRLALCAGADIGARDAQGMTALMYAAKNNADPTVIKVLLMAAADFKERGLLQSWKSRPIFKTLDVNDRNEEGMTALMFAVENNSPDVVRVLLDAGADANAKNKEDVTALMLAVEDNSPEIAQVLLDAGADANAKNKEDVTALMLAVENNSPEVVQVLLDAGADANAKDKKKRTVLMRAVKKKSSPKLVKMLLGAGADVNAQDEKKRTVLVYAARYSDLEMMKILVDAGADIRAVENGQIAKELEKRIAP